MREKETVNGQTYKQTNKQTGQTNILAKIADFRQVIIAVEFASRACISPKYVTRGVFRDKTVEI